MGLPLSVALQVYCGHRVVALDINTAVVDRINAEENPYPQEHNLGTLLTRAREQGFTATADIGVLEDADAVIVLLGTGAQDWKNLTSAPVYRWVSEHSTHLQPGTLVVVMSTVEPGTMDRLVNDVAIKKSLNMAFCPERVAEGHAIAELRSLPQLVGAETETIFRQVVSMFQGLMPDFVHLGLKEAEFAKLATNAWRYMEFAIANQLYAAACAADIDFGKVFGAITQDYPRLAHVPGPGFAAGPCLLKDTRQLRDWSDNGAPYIDAAIQINQSLPSVVVGEIQKIPDWNKVTIGILGMAFKADIDDFRAALSFSLAELLVAQGCTVVCSDPYLTDGSGIAAPLVSESELLERAGIVIVAIPHREYNHLPMREGQRCFNIWSIHRHIVGNT